MGGSAAWLWAGTTLGSCFWEIPPGPRGVRPLGYLHPTVCENFCGVRMGGGRLHMPQPHRLSAPHDQNQHPHQKASQPPMKNILIPISLPNNPYHKQTPQTPPPPHRHPCNQPTSHQLAPTAYLTKAQSTDANHPSTRQRPPPAHQLHPRHLRGPARGLAEAKNIFTHTSK